MLAQHAVIAALHGPYEGITPSPQNACKELILNTPSHVLG
jgi:hypothetical protein